MTDEYSSFLDLNLDEVPDIRTVKGGDEYRLKVASAEIKESRGEKTAGQKMLALRFDIVDEPDTSPVFDYMMLKSANEDEERNNQRLRRVKEFIQALGWDPAQGFNIEELVGEECFAILSEEDDPNYGKQNRIQRFSAPQAE
jgi:hypothetical protein